VTFEVARRRLVAEVAEDYGVRNHRVLDALAKVPRHLFVDEALWVRAYTNDALPIGYGQTISKPSTVARMTEALDPHPQDRVLEVGTGSGYQGAVLSCLVARVYSVERLPALAVRARSVLTQLGAFRTEVRSGDGTMGWPEEAPFQGILVTAAAEKVPQALLNQLALGGRLVLPLNGDGGQRLRRLVRTSTDCWREDVLDACRFVPLVVQGL
jgi:protein-L-isoaspartate(D-aspartate) O-methyltransferase